MGIEDNKINWRTVFCKDPTFLHVTTYPDPDSPHLAVQPDPADLKVTNSPDGVTAQPVTSDDAEGFECTNTPDGTTTQPVVQADPALLKVTNTPDGVTDQPVVQDTARNLCVTNTPDGATAQLVTQFTGVHGIWPEPNAVRVNASQFKAGAGIQIVYTVPANKKLFITSSMVTAYETVQATSNCRMGVRNGADALQYWIQYMYITVVGQLVIPQRYFPALEALAGWDVFIESSHANISLRGLFHGWLEDS